MRGRPIATMNNVAGNPNLKCLQKDKWYLSNGAFFAFSQTMRFAADPTKVKFPAMVLAHAKINQDFVTLTPGDAAVEAATRGPRSSTEKVTNPNVNPLAFKRDRNKRH